jgi:hypothetical protein
MPEEPEERASRLFGVREALGTGGLLLPEVFGTVLEALIPGPQPGEALHKIIRELLSYKGERVLDNWESWDAFCSDMLAILSDGGWITLNEGLFSNTGKVIPEVQLTILYDPCNRARKIRVTVHDAAGRERKEAVARAWQRAGEFSRWLSERSELSPAIARARNKMEGVTEILLKAVQNPEPPPLPEESVPGSAWRAKDRKPGRPRNDGRPVLHGQNEWYRKWAPTVGWHSQAQARAAWNEEFPQKYLRTDQASAFRHEAAEMIKTGMMEWDKRGVGERGIPAHRYRWTGGNK